jgi:hypothetical protein
MTWGLDESAQPLIYVCCAAAQTLTPMQVATFVVHAYPLSPGARLCSYQTRTAILSTAEAAF